MWHLHENRVSKTRFINQKKISVSSLSAIPRNTQKKKIKKSKKHNQIRDTPETQQSSTIKSETHQKHNNPAKSDQRERSRDPDQIGERETALPRVERPGS